MIDWVIAYPMPWPRHSGDRKIVPIQPTVPFRVPTPVPTIAPSTSATIGTHAGWVVAKARNSRRTPQSWLRIMSTAGSTSAGSIGRKVTIAFSIIRRWPDSPALTSSTSRFSPAFD